MRLRLALAALAIAACRPSVPSREVSDAPDGEAATAPSSTSATSATTPSLQRVPGRLATGDDFTCVIDETRAAWCWGNNDRGQLGNGSELPSARPVRVVNLGRASALAAGSEHACALVEGGEVWCWGANASRQLGDRTTDARRVPVRVRDIGPATAILAGPAYSCAAVDAGVLCWGDAPPHSEPRWEMQKKPGPLPVAELARIDFACGERSAACAGADGRVLCWGHIGPHVVFGRRWLPAIDDAVAVACGHERACALRRDGVVLCSGDVKWMFDGHFHATAEATRFDTAPPAIEIVDNGSSGCLLDQRGAVWCWPTYTDWRNYQPEGRMITPERVGTQEGFVALAAAAALAEEGSTARKALMTTGIATAGVAFADFIREKFSESRGGIGVRFHDRRDALVIETVRPLSAAAVAGLLVGDELLEVDGLPVAQLGSSEALRRLRGPIGSPIAISVRRPTSNAAWKLTLIRTPL